NHDSNEDVAVALAGTNSVSIFLGDGNGSLHLASTIGLNVPGTGMLDAIVEGAFGNGHADLAVAIANTGNATDDVIVLMNDGSGTFTQSSPIAVGLGPISIASGAFGSSGHLLAVANIGSGDVTILTNQDGGDFSYTQTIVLPGGLPAPTSIL